MTMNSIFIRSAAIVLHVLLNIILINYLVNIDPTGSWLKFTAFILAMLVLLILFIKHVITFISFIKSVST